MARYDRHFLRALARLKDLSEENAI